MLKYKKNLLVLDKPSFLQLYKKSFLFIHSVTHLLLGAKVFEPNTTTGERRPSLVSATGAVSPR